MGALDEWRLGADGNYGKSRIEEVRDGVTNSIKETVAENMKAFFTYRRRSGSIYAYLDSNVLHDDPGGIDYRATAGIGLGGYILDNAKSKLNVELGAAYLQEELTTGPKDDYAVLRFAARHEGTAGPGAKVWGELEYLPRADDLDDYLMSAELGIEAAVNSTMSLRLVGQDRVDSTPPEGKTDNDLTVVCSLVWKL